MIEQTINGTKLKKEYFGRGLNMKIYDELKARGLIAQVTNEEEISNLINNGGAKFYIGFDCTADSLTAGHFMARADRRRHNDDRRSLRAYGYAQDAHKGGH